MASFVYFDIYEMRFSCCDMDTLFAYGKWVEHVLDRILPTFPSLSSSHNRFLEFNSQQREASVVIEFLIPNVKEEDLIDLRDNCRYIIDFLATNEGDYLPIVANSPLPPPINKVCDIELIIPPRPNLDLVWEEVECVKEEIIPPIQEFIPIQELMGRGRGRGRGRGINNN